MEENYEVEKLSLMERLKYFFINPGKVFEQYIEKPTVLIKLVIIAIGAILTAVVTSMQKDVIINESLKLLQGKNLPAQTLEAEKNMLNITLSAPVLIIVGLLTLAATVALLSLIYWGLTSAFKGTITFGQTVAVYTLAYMPKVVYAIWVCIRSLTTNSIAGLKNAGNQTFITTFTGVINIFSIWQIVLLVIGLAKVGKISKKKSAIIVILVTAIYLIITLGSFEFSKASASMLKTQ